MYRRSIRSTQCTSLRNAAPPNGGVAAMSPAGSKLTRNGEAGTGCETILKT